MQWSGFQGGPGLSVFHFRDFTDQVGSQEQVAGAVAKVDAFIQDIRIFIPAPVTLRVSPDVEELEDTTGELTTVYNASPAAATNGLASGGTNYAAAVGAVINWRTGGVRNGRRVRGKTFLVPLSSSAFGVDGTLSDSAITTLSGAAADMVNQTGNGDLGVYARPTAVKDAQGNPVPGQFNADGVWHAATSFNVPDLGAVLRSRRD